LRSFFDAAAAFRFRKPRALRPIEVEEAKMTTTRKIVFGAALVSVAAALAAASPAAAADFPASNYYNAPPPPASVVNWAGPYIGGTLGYEWGEVDNNPTHPKGIAGGIEGGFNWQHGNFVYGGETDINMSGARDTFATWQFTNPWFGTLRGRAGFTFGNLLVYGTGGLAVGSLTADAIGTLSQARTTVGWTGGAGVEVSITPHWSAKAEWLYLDFADRSFTVTGTDNGLTANLVRLGVNYHF
jgi:outer membrane immunogenic protein